MTTISAILIVKNEESHIADCLNSVRWSDEIIVLDSGSTDNTKQIAEESGARVYTNTDWQGFGRQRQIAQTYATSEWVFWVDADERVSDELAVEIQQQLRLNHTNIAFEIPRLSYVFGRYIRYSGWYPDYVVRLYPREKTQYDDALVHEKVLIADGLQVEKLKSDLIHYTYKDLNHYLTKSAHYAKLWADQKQINNKKSTLFQAISHGFGCFLKMYILKLGFLDGRQGFLLAVLSSHSAFIKYADLWVRDQN